MKYNKPSDYRYSLLVAEVESIQFIMLKDIDHKSEVFDLQVKHDCHKFAISRRLLLWFRELQK